MKKVGILGLSPWLALALRGDFTPSARRGPNLSTLRRAPDAVAAADAASPLRRMPMT